MDTELQELLESVPSAKVRYETSETFRKAIDDMMACFTQARESLSDEDYKKFLDYINTELVATL